MVSPVQKARLVSRDAVKKLDPRSITITRDDVASESIIVTIGETRSDDYRSETDIVEVRFRDYLIDVADYKIAQAVKPVSGDMITETINGTVRYFEVLPDGGSPEYREHDRDGRTWRVHTKERKAPP